MRKKLLVALIALVMLSALALVIFHSVPAFAEIIEKTVDLGDCSGGEGASGVCYTTKVCSQYDTCTDTCLSGWTFQ